PEHGRRGLPRRRLRPGRAARLHRRRAAQALSPCETHHPREVRAAGGQQIGPITGYNWVMSRKATLREELIAALTATLDTARAAHAAALEGATHSEARAENDKDTRGLEQSYLARGQAQRVEELSVALAATEAMVWRSFTARDAIEVSALVTV